MKTWYDVVEPHQDIKKGDFDEAVFAADLGHVALGDAPLDYNDPAMFFKKTYLTDGISNLLSQVRKKLTTGKGPSVVEIKTPFGGGKTHSLIAIYHYLENGEEIQSQLPSELKPMDANVAAVVGTHLNALEGNKRDGLTIRTLWGEIAYQLAGKEGYAEFEKTDEERVSPGKEKLRAFLEKQQPFVILLDEVSQYITKARGVDYEKTNLGSQTFAFLQELTETVSAIENSMLVVTLPSSVLEDFTEKEEESLAKLDKIFGRIEAIETPVKGEEVYSIIQRRLFSNVMDEDEKNNTVLKYFEMYQQQREDLPAKARDQDYKRKMMLAYPFHPEVIDILYEKWGTFSSFQRTRGVLRLLANVVEALYTREKNIDIILPSDLPLDEPSVREEFLRHIGSEYESIIGSDISGHEAKAVALDKENRGWKHLAERISSAIFFYSFSGDKSEKGATLQYIKFSVLHTDTLASMVTEVLQRLTKTLWYLNTRGDMYRFSKLPNLNRMILDKKELYEDKYVDDMKRILDKEVGNAFASYLWPKNSESIPDNKEIKLAVLSPDQSQDTAEQWLEKRGNTFRTYKNTLIFAMADPSGHGAFKEDIKTYLALKDIQEEIQSDEESGLQEKEGEVKERLKKIKDDFSYNARRMYNILLVGDEKIHLGQPTVGRESLSNWYKMELKSREKLASNLHYRFIAKKFMVDKETVATDVIMNQFYKNQNLVIPESPEVIKRCIQQGVAEGAFALSYIEDGDIDKSSFKYKTNIATNAISLDEGEILIAKQQARQIQKEIAETEEGDEEGEEAGGEKEREKEGEGKKGSEGAEGGTGQQGPRLYRKLSLRIEDIPASSIADLNRGVLKPLTRDAGGFNFNIEIDIDSPEGVSEKTLKEKVKETISQIGAKLSKEDAKE